MAWSGVGRTKPISVKSGDGDSNSNSDMKRSHFFFLPMSRGPGMRMQNLPPTQHVVIPKQNRT